MQVRLFATSRDLQKVWSYYEQQLENIPENRLKSVEYFLRVIYCTIKLIFLFLIFQENFATLIAFIFIYKVSI